MEDEAALVTDAAYRAGRIGRRTARPERLRRAARIVAAIGIIGACGISFGSHRIGAVLGRAPTYGPALTGTVPNLGAIDRFIWMPGLDSGWDPQGLAVVAGNLFVSAYRSDRFDEYRGPCRVFRIDPASGRETGHIDVPAPCGHAGGLAYAGGKTLYIADTHTLFTLALDEAFAAAPAFRKFPLGRGVGGGVAASGNGAISIGRYSEGRGGKIFRFGAATLDRLPEGTRLQAGLAEFRSAIPSYAQGAAVDPSGALWIARGDIAWGSLEKLDPATGRTEARYPMVGGIEGIAFDPVGRLWAVSEAGARHIPLNYPFFPLIFRIDPARLRSGG